MMTMGRRRRREEEVRGWYRTCSLELTSRKPLAEEGNQDVPVPSAKTKNRAPKEEEEAMRNGNDASSSRQKVDLEEPLSFSAVNSKMSTELVKEKCEIPSLLLPPLTRPSPCQLPTLLRRAPRRLRA
eukprot:754556-Hanusia_phi.AAC.7